MKLKHLFILSLLALLSSACFGSGCDWLVSVKDMTIIACKEHDSKTKWGDKEKAPLFYHVYCLGIPYKEGLKYIPEIKMKLPFDSSQPTNYLAYEIKSQFMSIENLNTLASAGEIYLSTTGVSQCIKSK